MARDLGGVAYAYEVGEQLNREYPQIHVLLIRNAGVWPSELKLDEDGIEQAFMVNHLSSFLFPHLLLVKLKTGAPARAIFVKAGLHIKESIDIERLTPPSIDFG